VSEREGRFGFEMERIDGPLLAERMARANVAVDRPFGGSGLNTKAWQTRCAGRRLLDRFRRSFVDAYCRRARCSPESITAWLPVVAAARLCEEVSGESAWLLRTVADGMRA